MGPNSTFSGISCNKWNLGTFDMNEDKSPFLKLTHGLFSKSLAIVVSLLCKDNSVSIYIYDIWNSYPAIQGKNP